MRGLRWVWVSRWISLAVVASGGGASFGCESEGEPVGPRAAPICDAPEPGGHPLRRLLAAEWYATVEDLFGAEVLPPEGLLTEETRADSLRQMNTLRMEEYLVAAEHVSEQLGRARYDREVFAVCAPEGEPSSDCVARGLTTLASRVFRRPVATEEVDALMEVYREVRREQGYMSAFRAALESLLVSPRFLYLVEGTLEEGGEVRRLDGHSVAARLSYFLWGTMPSPELLAAAERGELDDVAGVERAARELLEDPRAEEMLLQFFEQYLELDQLDSLSKDPDAFPMFDEERTPALMREETRAFLLEVWRQEQASWETLVTAPWSMMNRELAEYYGVSVPAGPEFQRVELDPEHYAGILSQGSLTATRARADETHPIHRGMFVMGNLFCSTLPDFPDDPDISLPVFNPNLTTRQRLAAHRDNPACRACHEQMDPPGFAFEHFDGDGRFRTVEGPNDLPIDASGQLRGTDVDGESFETLADLGHLVARSEQAQECFVHHWFRYANRRLELNSDGCSLAPVYRRFEASGFDIRELIVALVTSDPFLYRNVDAEETPS